MIYPDLMMNLPDDPFVQARVSALWNASYGLGWALGPLFGAAFVTLFESTGDIDLCLDRDARIGRCAYTSSESLYGPAPVCSGESAAGPSPPPLMPPSNISFLLGEATTGGTTPSGDENCCCEWRPMSGFDGQATVVSIVSWSYALLLIACAIANIGKKEGRESGPTFCEMMSRLTNDRTRLGP